MVAHSFRMMKDSSEPPLAAEISVPCGMWPCTAGVGMWNIMTRGLSPVLLMQHVGST
jgi:hypothetical protein